MFFQKGTSWFERLKTNLTDKHTWLALVYFLLLGFLTWTVTMHLGRLIGQLHGRMAKSMLVTD